MTARRLVALVLKDLSLAWLHIGGFAALMVGLMLIVRLRAPFQSPAHQIVAFVLVPGQYLTAVVAQALIDRERSRGTFALLRTMPLSDGLVISSKFVLALALNLTGTVMFGVILAPSLFLTSSALAVWALATLFVVAFGHVVLAGWLIAGGRAGALVPFLVLGGLVLGFLALREVAPGWTATAASLSTTAQFVLAAAICVGLSAGAWLAALSWYRRRDAADLIS